MADETPGSNNDVYKVSLDAAEFVKALEKALQAYTMFTTRVSKKIKVHVDDEQLIRLAKLIGKEFKVVGDQIRSSLKPAIQDVGQTAQASFQQVTHGAQTTTAALGQVAQSAQTAKSAVVQIGQAAVGANRTLQNAAGDFGEITANNVRKIEANLQKLRRLQAQLRDASQLGEISLADGTTRTADASKLQFTDLVAENVRKTKKGDTLTFTQDERIVEALLARTRELLNVERQLIDAGEKNEDVDKRRVTLLRKEIDLAGELRRKAQEAAKEFGKFGQAMGFKDSLRAADFLTFDPAKKLPTGFNDKLLEDVKALAKFEEEFAGSLGKSLTSISKEIEKDSAAIGAAIAKANKERQEGAEKSRATAERENELYEKRLQLAKEIRIRAELASQKINEAYEVAGEQKRVSSKDFVLFDENNVPTKFLAQLYQQEKKLADEAVEVTRQNSELADSIYKIAQAEKTLELQARKAADAVNDIYAKADSQKRVDPKRFITTASTTDSRRVLDREAVHVETRLARQEVAAQKADRATKQLAITSAELQTRARLAADQVNRLFEEAKSLERVKPSEFLVVDKDGRAIKFLAQAAAAQKKVAQSAAEARRFQDSETRAILESADAMETLEFRAQKVLDKIREIYRKAGLVRELPQAQDFVTTNRSGEKRVDDRALYALEQRAREESRVAQERLRGATSATAKAQQENARAIRLANAEAGRFLNTQSNISLRLVEQGVRLAKFIVYYRIIQDSLRAFETSVRAIARAGIEYQKAIETQQLGLRGILAENYKIRDQQGTLLQDQTLYAALVGESGRQWAKLQQSSLAVVGTTEDLMLLYNSILPFASKLGKGLEDVQQMTKATAVAASLMNISFQDARTAIISLLQGRALTRNRLVGVLGFTESDVKSLKGTEKLFETVMERLDAFQSLAPEAQNTIAALQESFREFMGLIGRNFVSPFLEEFRRFVGDAKKQTGLAGLLFEDNDKSGLRLKASVAGFFRFVQSEISNAVTPITEFGRELKKNNQAIYAYASGVGTIGRAVSQLLVWLARAALAVTKFTANNADLIKVVAKAAVALAALRIVYNVGQWYSSARVAVDVFLGSLRQQIVLARASSAAMTATQAAAVGAGSAIRGSALAMNLLRGVGVGAAIAVLGLIAEKYLAIRNAANQAKAAEQARAEGRYFDAAGDQAQLSGGQRNAGHSASIDGLRKDIVRLKDPKSGNTFLQRLNDDGSNLSETYEQLAKRQQENNKLIASGAKISKERRAALQSENLELERQKKLIAETGKSFKEYGALYLGDIEGQIRSTEELLKKSTERRALLEEQLRERITRGRQVDYQQVIKQERELGAKLDILKAHRFKAQAAVRFGSRIEERAEQADAIKFEPQPDETPDLVKRFRSDTDDDLRFLEAEYNAKSRILQEFRNQELISEREFNDSMDKLEVSRLQQSKSLLEVKARQLETFAKTHSDSADARDQIEDERRNITVQRQEIEREIETSNARRLARTLGNAKQLEEINKRAALEVSQQIAQVFGQTEDKVEITLNEIADRIEHMFDGFDTDRGKVLADQLRAIIPTARDIKVAERSLQSLDGEIGRVQDTQSALELAFQNGSVGLSKYVDGTRKNRDELRRLLLQQNGWLAFLRDLTAQNLVASGSVSSLAEAMANPSVQAFTRQIQQNVIHLEQLNDKAAAAAQTVNLLGQAIGALSGFAGIFADMNSGVASFLGGLGQIIQVAGQLGGLKQQLGGIKAAFEAAKGGEGGSFTSGLKGVLGFFGGGGASTAAAVTGGLSLGITAFLGIATAFFRKAVEKAKKAIEKSIATINEAISSGAINLGSGLEAMIAERRRIVREYSKSKSGREALKQVLPGVDQSINALKERIKDIQKAFERSLEGLRAGNGPFGDFTRQMIDVQKQINEYLGSFDAKDAEEWARAVANAAEMFSLTLKEARRAFQEAMNGFEQEAISSMEKVFTLMDEREGLFDRLTDMEKQRLEVEKELAKFPELEAKRVKEIEKARKRIADIIKEAAAAEAGVRREGVFEAALTVAQRKSIEIANIRQKASEDLADARENLAELEEDNSLQERKLELEQQELESQREREKLQFEIEANAIRLSGAQQIAGIEGDVFDLSSDRLELVRRSTELEIESARIQVEKWRQTKELVDAIIQQGEGFIFNAPPGFPQVRVSIDQIVIDNRDMSQNSQQTIQQMEFDRLYELAQSQEGGGIFPILSRDQELAYLERRYPNFTPSK